MNYQDLSPADAQLLLEQEEAIVFDIRDSASIAQGQMTGAQPVTDQALMQMIKARQRNRPVLVYCYHGNSSREMCQFIAGMGFTRVYNLAGGWQAWEAHLMATAPGGRTKETSPVLEAWMGNKGFPAGHIHARTDNGKSPLMLAALEGEIGLVEELVALGADPNHLNDDHHHALWFACVHGNPYLVERLIGHGANVDDQNVNGATCAIYAASTGKLEVLRKLVEAGADLGKETDGGYSALESASTLPVLKYLRGITQEPETSQVV